MGKEYKLRCFLDGDALCIVDKNFKNIQESECVFIKLSLEDKRKIIKLEG